MDLDKWNSTRRRRLLWTAEEEKGEGCNDNNKSRHFRLKCAGNRLDRSDTPAFLLEITFPMFAILLLSLRLWFPTHTLRFSRCVLALMSAVHLSSPVIREDEGKVSEWKVKLNGKAERNEMKSNPHNMLADSRHSFRPKRRSNYFVIYFINHLILSL